LLIQQVIEQEDFYHVFQPIYDIVDRKEIGFEVLLRTNFVSNPELAFQEAKKEKKLFELDSRSIQKAIMTYFSEGSLKNGYLFVNIYPSTILHPNFPLFLKEIMTDKNVCRQMENQTTKIVFEISESEHISDSNLQLILKRFEIIKEYGILIAIDDIGKGFNLPLIIELAPNFLKLDRYFSKNLSQSKQKQMFINLLKNYCDHYNSILILEGIENEIDLDISKSLGIRYVQGYLIGRPGLLKNKISFFSKMNSFI
jgi:EAL domain-containing protein (putative c-di-GMP-specific phosphodiesterase class I)